MQIKFILTLLVLLLTTQITNSATIQEQKDVYKELQAVEGSDVKIVQLLPELKV